MGILRAAVWVAVKDLTIQWRTRHTLVSATIFGVLILVVFNLGFHPDERDPVVLTPGILWAAYLFAGTLGFERSFQLEREDAALRGLLASPLDRGALYLGKVLANFVVLTVLALFLAVVHFVFFAIMPSGAVVGSGVVVLLLGIFGYVAMGTLMAAVAGDGTGASQGFLLPILLIPLASPILVAAVRSSAEILSGGGLSSIWFQFMLVYDVVFLVLGFLVFEFAVED